MEIIPNIPNEIGRQCLLRVTYKSHDNLKTVCRSWEATGTWDRLPSIPQFPDGFPLFCHCLSVDQKLVMIGGWNPSSWETLNSVLIYNFTSGIWRRGADMPTVRSFFASSVSPDGLIYVAGGQDHNKNALRTAEAYDVRHDKWEILPPMSRERDRCHGVFLDGKFNVISGYATEAQGQFQHTAEVFDHNKQNWSGVENIWLSGETPTTCLAALGHLYFFHNQQMSRYNGEENFLEGVASLPKCIDVATCATAWRDKIFVSGSTSRWGEQVCYMYHNSGTWVPIERPHDFEGFVQTAVTVEL